MQAVTRVNTEQSSKRTMHRPTWPPYRGRLIRLEGRAKQDRQSLCRGSGNSMHTREAHATRETPSRGQAQDQPDAREGQAGRDGVAERLAVPGKPGNAGGGKEPWFKADAGSDEGDEIGVTLRNSGIFSSCVMHTMWKRRKNSNLFRGTPLAGNGRRGWLRKLS